MSAFFKKIFAVILAFFQSLVLNVNYGEYVAPENSDKPTAEIVNNIDGDSNLVNSIKYAAEVDDIAQAYYTDAERSAFKMANSHMVLTHDLTAKVKDATLTDTEGNTYVADSFDTYYISGGKKHYSSSSKENGRINAIRIGEYYTEVHVRDLDFNSKDFKVDKAYHLYGDKIYSELSLFACEATTKLEEFGSEIKIDKSTVASVQFEDKNGIGTDVSKLDSATVEYIAFDIDGVGIVGFIVPSDGSTKALFVENNGDDFIVRQIANYIAGTGINKHDETGDYSLNKVTFGFRLYTDDSHSFDSVAKQAELERNPLEGITVNGGNAHGAYLGYEALRGTYTFRMDGTDFSWAYNHPTHQYSMPISVTCDGNDRNIFIRTNGENGCLEAGAILDSNGVFVPVAVQVDKNFCGDGGEPFYSVKDYQYGDCFFPLSLKANETLELTVLNLYQNWGNVPLKQLSGIEFHVSYYHLSTGTTESNCIAPYFVFEKDGWTLPDFRTRSGIMWAEQPQFNSVGTLKFVTYNKKALGFIDAGQVYSEYKNAQIDSVGPVYSDITNTYESDCGSYTYTLRHVEFPQTDENRTYYEVNINFNREITFDNFKRDFDLFYFDGRYANFTKLGYLDENNESVVVPVNTSKDVYYTLGDESPYWGFFDVTADSEANVDNHFGCNFAMLVKDSEIIADGTEQDIAFAVRDSSEKELTSGSLTLDVEEITFKPGDSIKLNLVLLPWGQGKEENDSNVRAVREDSGTKAVKVTAITGTLEDDALVPTIRVDNNVAEIKVTGGRNNNVVRFNGFTELECPTIYIKNGDSWTEATVCSEKGYDGYGIHYNEDGTYGFSFVYSMDNPDQEHTFRLVQE